MRVVAVALSDLDVIDGRRRVAGSEVLRRRSDGALAGVREVDVRRRGDLNKRANSTQKRSVSTSPVAEKRSLQSSGSTQIDHTYLAAIVRHHHDGVVLPDTDARVRGSEIDSDYTTPTATSQADISTVESKRYTRGKSVWSREEY